MILTIFSGKKVNDKINKFTANGKLSAAWLMARRNKYTVPVRKDKIKCVPCDKVMDHTDYAKHYRLKHMKKQKRVDCPECGVKFKTKFFLKFHMRRAHNPEGM